MKGSNTRRSRREKLAAEIDKIKDKWVRIGGGFTGKAAMETVDPERLLIDTVRFAPMDERLWVIAASWLVLYRQMLNAHKLNNLIHQEGPKTQALLGAMLDLSQSQSAIPSATVDNVACLLKAIRPTQFMFDIVDEYPPVAKKIQAGALPLFLRWGFWHNDDKLKTNTIHTTRAILRRCPEIRIRAFMGPSYEADICVLLAKGVTPTKTITRETSLGEEEIERICQGLEGRGLIQRNGKTSWTLTQISQDLLSDASPGQDLTR